LILTQALENDRVCDKSLFAREIRKAQIARHEQG
jgi:hypothetical protein